MSSRTYTLLASVLNADINPAQGWAGFGAGIINTGSDSDGFFHLGNSESTVAVTYANDNAIPTSSAVTSLDFTLRAEYAFAYGQIFVYTRYGSGPAFFSAQVDLTASFANYIRNLAHDGSSAPWTIANLFVAKFGLYSNGGLPAVGPTSDQYASRLTFTVTFTLPAPVATTTAASGVTAVEAQLNGTVNPTGATSSYPVSYHFEYGPTTSYGTSTATVTPLTGAADSIAVAALTGLTSNSLYHFRLVATNDDQTINGADLTFTTAGGDRPLYIL